METSDISDIADSSSEKGLEREALELLGASKLSSRAKSAEFSGRGGGWRTGSVGGLVIRMFGSLCDDGLSSRG